MSIEIVVVSLFPEIVEQSLGFGVIKRAFDNKQVSVRCLNYRDFTSDKHQTVDCRPSGGGPGMLLRPDICYKALEHAKDIALSSNITTIALTPAGLKLTQQLVESFAVQSSSSQSHVAQSIILFCGRYEGFDQRFLDGYIDICLSIGDFVLSGGEYPALCFIDALCRLMPGTIKEESAELESFSNGLLDYPQYTKPHNFEGVDVPSVLLSGNHAKIQTWRKKKAFELTSRVRPDLLKHLEEIES